MRSDSDIKQDVHDELIWDPSLNEGAIEIDVRNGVVTLSGTVDSYAQERTATIDAERVWGVNVVVDHLDVVVPTDHARSDADIARAVNDALQWNIEVPPNRITARVDDGFVTLDGTVDWYYQKTAATDAVQYLRGVCGVTNNVKVQPQITPRAGDVTSRIVAALKRSAEADAQNISVDVDDSGTVTLRGTAHSWAERQDAERAAWAAPGVRNVNDELTLES